MKNQWFVVNDYDEFINATRIVVFNNFASDNDTSSDDILNQNLTEADRKELDSILSFDESKIVIENFIRKQKNKNSSQIRYLVSDESYIEIIEALHSRMISNILNSLVNKGLIESGFDEESNDFIFWVNDNFKAE